MPCDCKNDLCFQTCFGAMTGRIHSNARSKGFWEPSEVPAHETASRTMLVVTELAEFIEEFRNHTAHEMSEKVPGVMRAEEELADAVIRCMDIAGGLGLDLGNAIARKHEYNLTRPPKHGKAF